LLTTHETGAPHTPNRFRALQIVEAKTLRAPADADRARLQAACANIRAFFPPVATVFPGYFDAREAWTEKVTQTGQFS
jgi:hypothetical protein